MRRTKIVATIGPATWSPTRSKALLHAGSTSSGPTPRTAHPTDVRTAKQRARAAASAAGTVGVLVDLPGPKLRTGPVVGDEVELRIDGTFGAHRRRDRG